MKKSLFLLFILAGFIIASFPNTDGPSHALQTYRQARDGKDAQERLLFAQETTGQSNNADVVHEAVMDMVNYSSSEKDHRIAMERIGSALTRIPESSDAYREMVFAKGKLLARMSETKAAGELFQQAIQKQWKNAPARYRESLIENGFWEKACILEFERIAGLPEYQYDRSENETLDFFLALLRKMKHEKPDPSAVACVYEKIQRVRKENPFREIARALCLAEDKNVEDGVAVLRKMDAILAKYSYRPVKSLRPHIVYKNHSEYRNIPLYIASILTKQGNSTAAANEAFAEFMKRNPGHDEKIVKSAIRMAWDMDLEMEDHKKKDEFLSFLIESDWFKDPNVQGRIGADNLAIIYDQLQMGLAWSEKWDESARICKYAIERYPDTLGGQNCLHCYGLYIGWHDNNEAESIRIFNEILKNAKSDILAANARVILTELAMKKGNYKEALSHINDALNRISPYERGWKSDVRRRIEILRSEIMKKIEEN